MLIHVYDRQFGTRLSIFIILISSFLSVSRFHSVSCFVSLPRSNPQCIDHHQPQAFSLHGHSVKRRTQLELLQPAKTIESQHMRAHVNQCKYRDCLDPSFTCWCIIALWHHEGSLAPCISFTFNMHLQNSFTRTVAIARLPNIHNVGSFAWTHVQRLLLAHTPTPGGSKGLWTVNAARITWSNLGNSGNCSSPCGATQDRLADPPTWSVSFSPTTSTFVAISQGSFENLAIWAIGKEIS